MIIELGHYALILVLATAVVQSIFLVIVLDSVFAVFFSSIGWK